MKKVLLFAFTATIVSTVAHAQIDKGAILLGGTISLNHNITESTTPSSSDQNKVTDVGIMPAIGIAIKPNTIVGIQLGYGHNKSSIEPNSGSQKYNIYRAEIFLRKYMGLGKGFYLFAQPGIFFYNSSQENKYTNLTSTNKGWSTGLSLNPGLSYAVNKNFHLEAGLGNLAALSYGKTKYESKPIPGGATSRSKGSSFSFSSSLSNNSPVSIGFRFFLSKKGKSS